MPSQSPPVPQPAAPPSYILEAISPDKFPVLTGSWPPLRAIYQTQVPVQGVNMSQPPDMIRFSNSSGVQLDLPIFSVSSIGPDHWLVSTVLVLVPHVAPGPLDIQAFRSPNLAWSNILTGDLP